MLTREFDPVTVADTRVAEAHFQRWFYAAVMRTIEGVIDDAEGMDDVFERFPFLAGYTHELAVAGLEGLSIREGIEHWERAILTWEDAQHQHLPLRAIRSTSGLDANSLILLLAAGLGEEDARFGTLIAWLHGNVDARRPTAGLFARLWGAATYDRITHLMELGLLECPNHDASRSEWTIRPPLHLWNVLRGSLRLLPSGAIRHIPAADLPNLDQLILSEDMGTQIVTAGSLLEQEMPKALIIHGPVSSGRRTILGALAKATGRGLIIYSAGNTIDRDLWTRIGPLATALNAMPAVELDLSSGELAEIPDLLCHSNAIGVVIGHYGAVRGVALERSIELQTGMPDAETRTRHWQAALGDTPEALASELGSQLRLTGGTIRRIARAANIRAKPQGQWELTRASIQRSARDLNREGLESFATYVAPLCGWSHLGVSDETFAELRDLERRCLHREQVAAFVGPTLSAQLTAGVRALFAGPSGTGKTLAARLLAGALKRDLYRLDLSAVVDKYIGETEKRLEKLLTRADELDVVLLFDEGDALMTSRTDVQSANDRYANLETNFLLQRLESFEGILIVTTNAADRIDGAFKRRMDVIVSFSPPGPAERLAIWTSHLPKSNRVPAVELDRIARLCDLNGGQIRNVVLHAALLSIEDGGTLTTRHLRFALAREYRKSGVPSPLPPDPIETTG